VKHWNIREADWKNFCLLTGESVERLPSPDTTNIVKAYQELCESLLFAAEECIPPGRRKNYVPYWNKEWKTICRSFLQNPVGSDSDRATSPLLSRLEQKRQENRKKLSIPSISRTQAPLRAASLINVLAGLVTPRLCPISANSIASQLVKNEEHKTGSRESNRHINKELSDL